MRGRWIALARTRSQRVLEMAMGDGRGLDGKNRTIFRCGVQVVDSGGGGNSALMDFVGTESQGERI